MPIRACLDCGSDRLVFPKGASTAFTCDDCGWSGVPAEHASYAAWKAWRESRGRPAQAAVEVRLEAKPTGVPGPSGPGPTTEAAGAPAGEPEARRLGRVLA